ncbi:MAG: HesA/MoeB/ThiF family protein [Methanomicrobiaceae archaeon]|uniref:Sulfur carrier protein adenylyltransferase thif n=1 Tax=hydrocarbon metagenome TaxID=938273 RepID=A0A0W8FID6_9ZZZZ|nr:HesA/MoeB/ThiF family protein [Methanomicrobiaceae archaeon]
MQADERERYRRQILLFGEEGQERLREAEIFIAGAGGLGSPVAIYLAAAGIGTITIADHDTVSLSNLNRQILHRERDIGREKVESAAERLRELNPEITVRTVGETIRRESADRLVGSADGIVDALDNFPTRYLLNRTALSKGIPLFHGGIRGFYGQATTIVPGETGCLECIFPCGPPEETVPVIGVTAGIIGLLQANEVIKYLLGTGDLLAGRLLLWDGLKGCMDELCIEKNPRCPACGTETDTMPAGDGNI